MCAFVRYVYIHIGRDLVFYFARQKNINDKIKLKNNHDQYHHFFNNLSHSSFRIFDFEYDGFSFCK